MDIASSIAELVEIINQAIPATLDPRDVNPPSAWVAARSAKHNCLDHWDAALTADIFLISPDSGAVEAHKILSNLLEQIVPHLIDSNVEINGIDLDSAVTLPTGGSPQPAYRINVTY